MRIMQLNRDALRTIRERSGMSQLDLARAIGTSAGYLNDIESGRRHPSAKVIRQLADALAVSLPAILLSPESVAS